MLEQHISISMQQKWLTKLMGYDFDIVLRSGRENKAATALSRLHESIENVMATPFALGRTRQNQILINRLVDQVGKKFIQSNQIGSGQQIRMSKDHIGFELYIDYSTFLFHKEKKKQKLKKPT